LTGLFARKARILPSLGKESSAGNMRITATARDDGTPMAGIGKVPGIDILSGETGHAQV